MACCGKANIDSSCFVTQQFPLLSPPPPPPPSPSWYVRACVCVCLCVTVCVCVWRCVSVKLHKSVMSSATLSSFQFVTPLPAGKLRLGRPGYALISLLLCVRLGGGGGGEGGGSREGAVCTVILACCTGSAH